MAGPKAYEMPFRPPYEYVAAVGWGLCAVGTVFVLYASPFPKFPFAWAMPLAIAMTFMRFLQGRKKQEEINNLRGHGLELIGHDALHAKLPSKQVGDDLWLGSGFEWSLEATKNAYEVLQRGPEKIIGKVPPGGAHWVHAVGGSEENLFFPTKYMQGHAAIQGTTGSGKTRLLDIMITQLASRGVESIHDKTKSRREAVIIIDPKGDKGLFENAKKLCEDAGEPDRFVYFHPAFPENSACIDVMRNFNTATELASRIAAIIPSETGSDPFVAFSWKALNDICAGLLMINNRPNLVKLRRNVEAGVQSLLEKVFRAYFAKVMPDWESRVQPYETRFKNDKVKAYTEFYQQVVAAQFPEKVIEGLINGYTHERTHYQKMTASLIPILTMVTSGHLADLLSPEPEKLPGRICTDMASIIAQGKVCYIALNSLADSTVGSAIGSMMLSDLAAVAGDRYNYGVESQIPITVFADEAGETINAQLIQLLNKGRGAGFRVVIAYQTVADLVVRTGSEHAAKKVLGNVNNLFCLRVPDPDTREFFCDKVGKINIPVFQYQYKSGSDSKDPSQFSGGYSEAVRDQEVDRIMPRLLSELPDLHYFATLADGRCIKSRIPVLVANKVN